MLILAIFCVILWIILLIQEKYSIKNLSGLLFWVCLVLICRFGTFKHNATKGPYFATEWVVFLAEDDLGWPVAPGIHARTQLADHSIFFTCLLFNLKSWKSSLNVAIRFLACWANTYGSMLCFPCVVVFLNIDLQSPSQTKVADDGTACVRHKNIVWLQISVNYIGTLKIFDGTKGIVKNFECMDLGEVDWIDLGEQRIQIFLVIIHDKEQIIKSFQVCLAANRQDYVE